MTEKTSYPDWVMYIAYSMILAGVLPMPIVYVLRRFQILKVDLDIHQGSIRRNETTASTKEIMDEDDVSWPENNDFSHFFFFLLTQLKHIYTHLHMEMTHKKKIFFCFFLLFYYTF